MNNREPIILPLASKSEIERDVNDLIAPETADLQARILIDILTSCADFETPEKARYADAVIRAAYAKTFHCERQIQSGIAGFVKENALRANRPSKENSEVSALIG